LDRVRRAEHRVVAYPELVASDVTWHLARFTGADDDALVFTTPASTPLRNGNFRRRVWVPLLECIGLPAIPFHDYADVIVMPTWLRTPCWEGVIVRKLSA